MAKKKETKPAQEEALTVAAAVEGNAENAQPEVVEEVETVAAPVGQVPTEKQEPQPALSAAPRISAAERQRRQEEADQRLMQRQEDAMIVGKHIAAAKRNNILSGRISGVEIREDHAFWMIYEGPVIVMIPFREAFPMFTKTRDISAVRQRQLLAKSIGATVPFAVEQIVPDEANDTFLVYGSRCNAVERIGKRYYGEDAPQPVKVGDIFTGTFISVGVNAAMVNVAGRDMRLIKRQLSHRYIENLMHYFKPGDEIKLCLQEISNANLRKGKDPYVFSALPCELEDCKRRYNMVKRGNVFVGTITSHNLVKTTNPLTKQLEAYYCASMWLEGVNVPAYANVTSTHSDGQAHSGDQVSVQVESISDNGYVRCRILRYLPH